MDVRSPFFQNIACVLMGVMFLNPIVSVAAEVTVDAAAAGNTSLTQAGNGVPVVNIATPSANGLSHNKFTDYNVGQQGLILNNATDKLQSTQLGGIIIGNSNLKGGAAGLILNEVTSGNPSQLRGYTEVAGQQAHVVVANPNGITCAGCGFINTPRVTLSTGKPVVEGGRLDRFDVEGGQVSIEGNGLNSSNVDQFDLITRSAQINAELHANQLNVITGRNEVDAASLSATAKSDNGSAKPQLAIDSSALGGMYAGAIRLVGTEGGVGVRLAGDMAASAGDIQIDTKGQLSMAQAAASHDIRLKGERVVLTGKTYAGRQVSAQAQQGISLAGGQSLAARESIELKGGQLNNQGLIEAGVNSDNSRNSVGDVALNGTSLRNSGNVIASRALSAELDGQLDNRAGTLSAKANTVIKAAGLDNREEGVMLANGALAVNVAQLDNRTGLIASGKALNISARSGLDNQDGEISSQTEVALDADSIDNRKGLIAAHEAISVQAKQLNNSQTGAISSKGTLTVTGGALDNRNGVIAAERQLSLQGESLANHAGRISGKDDVGVNMTSSLNNSDGGAVLADGQLSVRAAELSNGNKGQIAAKGDASLDVGNLSQQGGELLSQNTLSLHAKRIDNRQGGLIAANQGLAIQATERLDNSGGEISTKAKADIRVMAGNGQAAAELDNSSAGLIIADQGLSLTVQRLLNHTKGVLSGRDSLVLIGDSLDNRGQGTLSSQRLLSVQLVGALQNQTQGELLSGGLLSVRAGSVDNRGGGVISSAEQLQLEGGALNNQGGLLVSDGQMSLNTAAVDNSVTGVISAKQELTLATGQLDNHQGGTIKSAAGLALSATQLNNHNQGKVSAKGAATLALGGLDQHAEGELVSESSLTLDLQGGTLNNSGKGLIATPGALLLKNLGVVDNSAGGEISSQQSFLLKAHQLNNTGAGRIISGQQLQLQINQALLNNLKGILSAATKLSIAAAHLDNTAAGLLVSQGAVQVALSGKLDNHDRGTLSAGSTLDISSGELDNSNDGLLSSGTALQLHTGELNNQSGSILSRTSLDAQTAGLNNRGGVLSSQQALTLHSAAIDNRDNGLITSASNLTLNATRLDSSRYLGSNGGEVSAKQNLQLAVDQLIQQQGRLIGEAGVSIDFKGGDLDNRGGLLSATGPLTLLNLGKLDNRDAGEVSSSQSYNLTATDIDNSNQGRLISEGTLTLALGEGALRNADRGLLSGWQGLTVDAGHLDNSARGTLSSREGALKVELHGSQRELNNSGAGALVGKGPLQILAGRLNNSGEGIVSSEGDVNIHLTGELNNSAGGLVDSKSSLTARADAVNNHAGQISSLQALQLEASSLDNSAGQLSSDAALRLTLTGNLLNTQQAKLASAGPLLLNAAAIDNQGGSLLSQSLIDLLASSLNNANGGTLAARNGLNLRLSGALNNSVAGLIHSQRGALGILAQSLDNQGGALSSEQDLTLSLSTGLDNKNGRIESLKGNLDLQHSSAVDNSSGVLSSLEGWLKLATAGLFDNEAGTTQAQSLTIEAQGIDNSSGHLSALSGASVIDSGIATFNNQSGGLYAHQLLKVIAGDFNNQGAAPGSGGKVAAGQVDFGLSGALNNRHGILESSGTLALAAASLDNQNGSLRALGSNGDTRIVAASLDNRSGKIETANTHLSLISTGLQNSAGSILHVGTGNFGLSAAQVAGAGGDLSTNGLLTLTADNWINSGVLQAGQLVLNIGNFTQTSSGKLLAGSAFTGSGITWTNHGVLASDGNFSLNLSGAYSGNGQVSSLGDLTLNAASVDISDSARVAGGGLTQVSATGLLNNLGKLTSASDLTVTANTLNNRGTLGSGGNLRLLTPALLNERGLIFSGSNMALRVNTLTNNYGDFFSLGGLSVARDDAQGRVALLENISGTLESAGDMRLYADRIVNRKDTFGISEKLVSGEITYQCLDCKGRHYDLYYFVEEKLERSVTSDSPAGSLVSGGNLEVLSEDFENRYSLVSAAGDISIATSVFVNEGAATSSVIRSMQLRNPEDSERGAVFVGMVRPGGAIYEYAKYNSIYKFNYLVSRGRGEFSFVKTDRQKTDKLNPHYNPNAAYPLPSRFADYRVISSTETVVSAGPVANASIQAGGMLNVSANSSFNNGLTRGNFVFAGGRTSVGETSAINTGKTTLVHLNPQLPPDLQQKQVNPLTLPGFVLPQGGNGLFRLSGQGGLNATSREVQGVASASTVDARSVNVVSEQNAQSPDAYALSAWQVAQGQTATGIPATISAISLPGIQGLPSSARPSISHRYLIETNPELTNLKQFLGSDYLLGKLGYTPDNTQKRLGDGLYEQRLIREAIVARTGQRFLAGLTSDEAMFRYLMDNALASRQALNLSLGVTLSAAQVAALTHDIVWMEEHEVLGEKVLVPVLYLAQAEGRLAANGALIQGRDVTLISGGELNNQGTLRATNSLAASAKNISNSGLVQAGERLSLLAEGSIRSAQGGIIAGRDVSLIALTGDVINERSVTRHAANTGSNRVVRDFVDSAARIEAANSLSLRAGRDVSNLGGNLDSRGGLAITAGRDVTLASVEERHLQARGSHYLNERVNQHGASVSAVGDVSINAGRDLTAIASRIQSNADVALTAKGDVLIASAANENHFLSMSKKVTRQTDQVRQQASVVEAGGDVTITAGNDLILSASQIKAGDEAYLYAGNQLALMAAQNSDYSLYDMKKKGRWGSKKTQRDETTTVRNVGSSVEAGGDITLVSEGDQLYQRARLESGGDLTLESGGAITFEGVKDLDQESHEKSKNSWAWTSAKGKGKTDETLLQSQLIAQGDIVIKAVEGLKVDIKQVNQQSVSQTIDALVKADPQLAWLKQAEARGDVDWRRVKEVHDSFKYNNSGLGAGAQLVIAIVASAFLGPIYGAMATNVAVGTASNGGDIGQGIKFAASSDNLKSYAVIAATQWATTEVFDGTLKTKTDPMTGKVTTDLSSLEGIGRFGANQLLQNTTSTGLSKALGMDADWGDVLHNSALSTLNAAMFNAVGDFSKEMKWADGSPQKVALHALVGGLLNEAAGGDFKTGAVAAGANELLVDQLAALVKNDQNMQVMASQLVGLVAAASVDGDVNQGAAIARDATNYNRLLHPDEEEWLKKHAKAFADKLGISPQEAMERLSQQAMREVDYLWRAQLTDGDDLAAQSFLKETRQTFVNDLGERQKLFTAEGMQLFRPEMFGDTADTAFYKQFVHSGISRSLSAGLTKELQDSGLAMKDGAFDLGKAVLEHPGLVVESVFEAVAGLPQSLRDGLVESGVSIGEGAAVSFDENLTDKINAIYGTDISGAQTALLAIRTIAAISGAGAVGKTGGKLTKELAEAVQKNLDKMGRAWESDKVLNAGEVAMSGGGNISAQQITRVGTPAGLNAAEVNALSKLDSLDSTKAGVLRETVSNSYFERNGFASLDGKCGAGNCFDGVYIKGDLVIINEVKPLQANGSIKLSGGNKSTDLGTQMSDEWIVSRANALEATKDPVKVQLAKQILEAKGSGKLTTVVSGVNRSGMVIVKVKP